MIIDLNNKCNFLDNSKNPYSPNKRSVLIQDSKKRLESLIVKGFEPAAPTITFRNRKLKLHLPLTKKKEESNNIKNDKKTDIKRVMSVDLGLLRLGTLSCWDIHSSDVEKDKEFARYFIKPRMLFDQKIVSRFERPSNIWQRIINIRAEIRYLQRKKNLYEQRLKQKGVKNFRKKRKWNELRRKISVLWDRVSNINEQIVHNLASLIVKIAKQHQIDLILVENLKFSHHSKKREKGRFLAFWQTHWFFSQVQSALDDLCVQNGLPKAEKIYAAYSSQECSKCHAKNERGKSKVIVRNPKLKNNKNPRGVLTKTRLLKCECGFNLDADLSAARVLRYRWRRNPNGDQSVAVSNVERQSASLERCLRDQCSKIFRCNSTEKSTTCDSRRY